MSDQRKEKPKRPTASVRSGFDTSFADRSRGQQEMTKAELREFLRQAVENTR